MCFSPMIAEAGEAATDIWTSAGVEPAAEAIFVAWQLWDGFDSGVWKGKVMRRPTHIRPARKQVLSQLLC